MGLASSQCFMSFSGAHSRLCAPQVLIEIKELAQE